MKLKISLLKAFPVLKTIGYYFFFGWAMTLLGTFSFHWLGGEIAREYHWQAPSYNACVDAVLLIALVGWLLRFIAILLKG
jgi:hypothetical protein